jgi:hypothetical protein
MPQSVKLWIVNAYAWITFQYRREKVVKNTTRVLTAKHL